MRELTKNSKGLYNLSDEQINAILELRLQKLTALGINEIEIEIKKLSDLIVQFKKIIRGIKNPFLLFEYKGRTSLFERCTVLFN